MARVNINILAISDLKWTRMGAFNLDDHYIYSCGQSLRWTGVALIVNESLKCSTWVQSQKWQNDLCFQVKPVKVTVIQVYAPSTDVKETEVEPTRPSRTNTKKDVFFNKGGWNAKVGSQKIPGITGKLGLGVQNEAGQNLAAFCQENTLVIANNLFHQHKRLLWTWTSPDGQHRNQVDYILCSRRWRSSI